MPTEATGVLGWLPMPVPVEALNSVSPVPTESTGVLGWLPGVGCTGTESHLQETGTQLQK